MLKKIQLFILLLLIGSANQLSAQCNTQASICTPGVAGPFNFIPTGGPYAGGSFANAGCNTGDGGNHNYGFITLYITQTGPLNILINGNANVGYIDVAIFNIPNGEDPCTAVLDGGNAIGCNFATNDGGCVQFGTAFPCGSSVPAPIVNAGDQVMIIAQSWGTFNFGGGESTTFNMELGPPPGAQTGPPDATITNVGPICDDAAPIQLDAVNMGGTWTGAGVSANGVFDPAAAGVGTHTINYSIGTAPCDDQDQITIQVDDCSTCFMTYLETNISACDPADNTFSISGVVEFDTPPATGQLIVEDCQGNTQVFNAPFTSPTNYNITGIDSDGSTNCDITAYFTADPLCEITSGTFNYPESCFCETEIGTFTDNVNGNTNTNGNPYLLCFGDNIDINGNNDFVPPQDFNLTGSTYDPGVWLLVYDCPPTIFEPDDLLADPCLLGVASTNDQAWNILNNTGDNSTLYFMPVTMYSMVDGTYAISLNNGDWCYETGPVYDVTFLEEILTNIVEDCQAGTASVTINGGLPSLDGSNFTLSNLQPATATLSSNTIGNGGTVTISGLADGDNYSFDIVDGTGCPHSISGTFTGVEDPSFSYPDNTYCQTQNNPTPTITGTIGGTFTATPAGLNIDPNSGLIDLSSATGTFTITYQTPDPVCFDTEEFIITINPEPIIDPVADQIVCDAFTFPAITGTNLTGAEAYYTDPNGGGINYNPGDIVNFADFASYPVTLYIYDETGTVPNCFDEEQFQLTINLTPEIDLIADQVACDSYTLPAITGNNLTGNESYYDAPGGTGNVLSPNDVITNAGVNTIYVYDETNTNPNCFDETQFDVTINLTPEINVIADQIVCDSYTLPAITGNNLTGNESYYDAPGGTGNVLSPNDVITNPGLNTIYIYDETNTNPNCFDETQFDVTINLTPEIDLIADQVVCDSYSLPAITGNNLTGNESYYDAPGGTGNVLNPNDIITNPGVNTIYIYDETNTAPNCLDETQFDVTINLTPEIDPIADQEECDSYTLPAITGNNLTGNEAYYEGANGTGTSYNAGDAFTTPGSTTLYIYDETNTNPNCFDEVTFEVIINVTPTFTVNYTDPTECALSDGTIIIEGLDPNTNYDVSYTSGGATVGPNNLTSDGTGTIIINGLAAGSYSDVTVSSNGCTTVDNTSLNLVEPNAPAIDAGIDQEVCEGTQVTLVADNPDGANISWDNGVTDGTPFTSPVGNTTYTVTAELDGCISSDQMIVTVNALPVINTVANQEECDSYTLPPITGTNLTGNEAYYDAAGGTGNTFNPGDVVTTAGTSTFYIYDETGTTPNCFDETQFDVIINITPELTALADQEECDTYTLPAINGNNLTGNEAYYDAINGGGNTFNPGDAITTAGQTTLYIYDETATTPNCVDETSFIVTINLTPEIDIIANQEECDSYTLPAITGNNLTGNEAYYDTQNGAGNSYNAGHIVTNPGTSTFYIYDQTGTTPNCLDETQFDVIINLTPEIDAISDQEECDTYTLPAITGNNLTNNVAYYEGAGGTGTSYNPGDAFTTPGTTTLYIYDETGTTPNCSDETQFDVIINVTPNFTLSSSDPTECSLNDGFITISGLVPGEVYQVTYTDGGTVVGPINLTADVNGDAVITGLTAGTFTDFIVSLNNCPATDNSVINLVDPNAPALDAGQDVEVCEGDEVTLTADNPDGATITWNNGVTDGQAFIQNVGTVTYTATADLNSCISTDQVTVTVHPNPEVFAGNNVIICENESVILTGSGANTYVWDNGVTDGVAFTPTETQNYNVIGTSIHGCIGTDQVIVEVDPLPEVSFEADNLEGCIPVTANFTNNSTPGDECTWYLGDGTIINGCDDFTHTYSSTGCFTVTLEVQTENGCTTTETFNNYICVDSYPIADFSYTPQNPTSTFSEVNFNNSSLGAVDYEWYFGDGNTSNQENPSNDYGEEPENYNVTLVAISQFGCTDTAYSIVRVIEDLIYYVPNTFTPDNNGVNETFMPVFTSGFNPLSYKLLIFNRWGEVLFESNDASVGWDGTYGVGSEEIVKDGTYVWKIEFRKKDDDERVMRVGHVNVLR